MNGIDAGGVSNERATASSDLTVKVWSREFEVEPR